jgi:tetraprenyl-beta-curcumene synthase
MRAWRARAQQIADPAIRREALDSLRRKAFHVHGGCVFATFLPAEKASRFVELVAAFETAVDYLDNLCDRIGAQNEADFRALHESLLDAVTPGAPLRDYFRHRPSDDRGYLNALVTRSQAGVTDLHSFNVVRLGIVDVTRRYCELQAIKHLAPGERERRCAAEFSSVAPDLSWWEGAAASGSTMATFALLFSAMSGVISAERVRAVLEAYFPYFTGLHILLDYFVDQTEDAAHGELNFVNCYPNAEEAHAGIERVARIALHRVATLPDAEVHLFALRAMCGYYCTRPALSKSARLAALGIMRAAGVDVDPHPLLKLYARMARA